jgi:large repetitive protein
MKKTIFIFLIFISKTVFGQEVSLSDQKPVKIENQASKTPLWNGKEWYFSTLDFCQDCCQTDDDCTGGGPPISKPNPPVITSNRNYVCSAQNNTNSNATSVTLTAAGCAATGMTWFKVGTFASIAVNALSITISPTTTTSYNATCSNAGGRSFRSNSIEVNFEQTPTTIPIVTRENTVIYDCDTIKLNASGCQINTTYLWKDQNNINFSFSGPQFNFVLNDYESYFTYCKGNYCLSNSTFTSTVRKPIYISKTTDSICNPVNSNIPIPVILTLHGCNKIIKWKIGSSSTTVIIGTDSILTVSPSKTTSYFAICTNASGTCGPLFSILVPVTDPPTISKTLITLPPLLGGGTVFKLTATCPNSTSYLWDNGSTQATRNVSSSTPGTYYVQCGSTCLSAKKTIKVYEPLIISSSKPFVCKGQSLVLSGSGCEGDIMWLGATNLNTTYLNAGINNPQTITIPNTAGLTQVYFKANCIVKNVVVSTSSVISIPVNTGTIPADVIISTLPTPAIINLGDSISLTATGCPVNRTFWNTLEEGFTIKKAPIEVTEYYAYCRTSTCPSNGTSIVVSVIDLQPPNINVSENSVCVGQQGITLSSSSCVGGVLKWYSRTLGLTPVNTFLGTGNTFLVNPVQTNNYYATCTFSGVKSAISDFKQVTVVGPPLVNSENNITHIYAGQSLVITASCGADTVIWDTGLISPSITVSPLTHTSYSAYCKGLTCQSTGTDITISVCPAVQNYVSPVNDFTLTQTTSPAKIIAASNKVLGQNTNIIYSALESISLFPGFKADNGTIFQAKIGGCN